MIGNSLTAEQSFWWQKCFWWQKLIGSREILFRYLPASRTDIAISWKEHSVIAMDIYFASMAI